MIHPSTPAQDRERLAEIARIIEAVDNRCLAADGPVTPTLREMQPEELRRIYTLASEPPDMLPPPPADVLAGRYEALRNVARRVVEGARACEDVPDDGGEFVPVEMCSQCGHDWPGHTEDCHIGHLDTALLTAAFPSIAETVWLGRLRDDVASAVRWAIHTPADAELRVREAATRILADVRPTTKYPTEAWFLGRMLDFAGYVGGCRDEREVTARVAMASFPCDKHGGCDE